MTAPNFAPDELGPAVLPGFEEVSGLEELVAETAQRKRERSEPDAKTVTPLHAQPLNETVLTGSLVQVDGVVSAMLEVTPLEKESLAEMAKGLLPLANYYASQRAGVTTLWIVAGLTMLSYAGLKFAQVRAKQGALHGQAEERRTTE